MLATTALVALGSSCQALGGSGKIGEAFCPELASGASALGANFAADARINGKVRTFVEASKDVVAVAGYIESEVTAACTRMGTDLGLSPAQMAPRNEPGGRASGACAAVSARIDSILQQGVGVTVTVKPPTCQFNAQAKASCEGACSAQVDPGSIVASCEPAKLSGYCQGRCIGQCDGTCNGQCNGTCSAVDAQGRCAGTCQGQCDGQCQATCHTTCQGTWQAPKCEGQVTPPSADAECNASCQAHAEMQGGCTPVEVLVLPTGNVAAAMQLVATLQANLPRLLYAEIALAKRLAGSIQVVGQVGAQLPKIAGNAGARALACIGAAAEATASASVRINVSVQASASVSGKVGAH